MARRKRRVAAKQSNELTISELQNRSQFLDKLPGAIIKLAKEDGIELTLPIKKRKKRESKQEPEATKGPTPKPQRKPRAKKLTLPPAAVPPAEPPEVPVGAGANTGSGSATMPAISAPPPED